MFAFQRRTHGISSAALASGMPKGTYLFQSGGNRVIARLSASLN